MKYIFSLLLVCSSYFSFSQMTLNELIKVYNMDMDQFETYAIAKGYEFNKFKKDENVNGTIYAKGVGKQTKYLAFYDLYFSDGKNVNFQTGNPSEMINIKNQLKSFGFKLSESYFNENGTQTRLYKKGKFELGIYTTPPNDEYDFVWYEISYKKY